MKVVIFAGGLGTRISEESHLKPKPMIEIGDKPMLWHIYAQKELAHQVKIEAFLTRCNPPAETTTRALWLAWNGLLPLEALATHAIKWLDTWTQNKLDASANAHSLAAQPDLATQILAFSELKSKGEATGYTL